MWETIGLFHFFVFCRRYLSLLFAKKIIDFLSPLISRQQLFGFMKNHSSLSQLLTFLSDIYHSVDCKAYTDVAYFDSIPHN